MQDLINNIQNNALAAFTKNAPSGVLNAIGQAASKTGVDFAYLVQQAQAESNFNPDVKAKTSSATGLFQFINSTWMNMVDKYGDKHGIDTNGMSKQEILDLRKDPEIASNMAAEFASENEQFLNTHWGGDVGSTELYFAHFMGAGGAASFLNARDDNGMQQAAVLFPKAAKANPNVFYERGTGRAKSLDEVYAFFDKKFQLEDIDAPSAVGAQPVDTQLANNEAARSANSLVFKDKEPNYYTSSLAQYQLIQSPIELMILSQLDMPGVDSHSDSQSERYLGYNKNSLFNVGI